MKALMTVVWMLIALAFSAQVVIAQTLLDKAIADYRAENYEEAVQAFTKLRQLEPSNSVSAFYLGLSYKQIGNLLEAIKNFEDALMLSPKVNDAYAEVIESYYNIGDDKNAMRWIKEAEAQNVTPAKISFLKGMVLMREGDSSAAIEAFNKSKKLDPSYSQAVDVKLAMIYAKERRLKDARKFLQNVMTLDPNSDIAQFAREYDKSIAHAIETYKGLSMVLNTAYQYDSNVKTWDKYALIPRVGNTKTGGLFGSFTLTYTPMPDGPFFISGLYNFTGNYYFKAHENHLTSHTFTLIPGYLSGKLSFLLPLGYTYVQMENRDPADNKLDGLSGYMGLVSFKPTLRYVINDANLVEISLGAIAREQYNRIDDPNEYRDGMLYSAAASYIKPFNQGQDSAIVRYEYGIDDAKGRNSQNKSHKFAVALNLNFPYKIALNLSADYTLSLYDHPNSNFNDITRKDHTKTLTAEIQKTIWKTLAGYIKYSYTLNGSNIGHYYYKRNNYFAGLEYRF